MSGLKQCSEGNGLAEQYRHESEIAEPKSFIACKVDETCREVGQPPALGGEPVFPELVSLADIPYANKTPESWDPDYRNIWQQLQVAQHNKAQLHEYGRAMRAHVARLKAEVERLTEYAEAESKGADSVAEDALCLTRQNRDLRTRNAGLEGLLRDAVGEIDFYRGDKHACKGLDIDAARAALAEGKEHE